MRFRAVVIGGSAGGVEALDCILSSLPAAFPLPVLVVEHLHPSDQGSFARHLAGKTRLPVVEPSDKNPIEPGCVYTAPADYHMLVEAEETISLSIDPRVNWSRPSIDVLFESAARVWQSALIAVILSGASSDGAEGIRAVRSAGGHTIAQDPATASSALMPQAAILTNAINEVLRPEAIGPRLTELAQEVVSLEGPAVDLPAASPESEKLVKKNG